MTGRVLQLSAYYPPHLGGQENVVRDLSVALARGGTDIEVLTSDQGATAGVAWEDGFRVTRLRSVEFAHMAVMGGLLPALLRGPRRTSLVHLHVGQAYTPEITCAASYATGLRYLVHLHIEARQSGRMGVLLPAYKKVVLRAALQRSAGVIVLNREHEAFVRDFYRYRGEVHVMSNGVGPEYFAPPRAPRLASEPLRLLFVGRLSPQKNLAALLAALADLRGRGPAVTLDLVGDGECRPEVEREIAARGLTGITLHGALPRKRTLDFYRSADGLVLPSLYEAQPLVLLEAMAARLPIVATQVTGVAEMVGDNGVLVEPTGPAIAAGIAQFAGMPPAAIEAMVERAQKVASAVSWSAVARDFEKLYAGVASAGR